MSIRWRAYDLVFIVRAGVIGWAAVTTLGYCVEAHYYPARAAVVQIHLADRMGWTGRGFWPGWLPPVGWGDMRNWGASGIASAETHPLPLAFILIPPLGSALIPLVLLVAVRRWRRTRRADSERGDQIVVRGGSISESEELSRALRRDER